MTFVSLAGFAWASLMAWYIGEVAVGDRKLCTPGECPDSAPDGIIYVRIGVWALLAIAIGFAAYYGRAWMLGDRDWRRLAIASGVAAAMLIAFVVLAIVWPPTYMPAEAASDF